MGATMLAGFFLLAMGIARMGQLIRFIPVTVVIGFTNGIAVVIFLAQIKDFFGLQIDNLPAEFFPHQDPGRQRPYRRPADPGLASVCFVFLLSYNRLAQRFSLLRRAPGPLVVLVVGTLVSFLFRAAGRNHRQPLQWHPAGTAQFRPARLSIHDFGKLISPAITIALLGAIESLLSARVADSQIDDRHDPNQELIAQGLANIAAPLFGGFAATGAIARTTTNVKTGGRTPIAGIIHALVLLGIVLIAAPLASYVPLATLSAIVMVVAVNMGEWHEFIELRRYSYNYRIILLATFFVTVVLRPDHCRRTRHGAGQPVLHLPHVGTDPHRAPAAGRGSRRAAVPLYPDGTHARRRLATVRLAVLWRGEQAGRVARPAPKATPKSSFSTWRA
jgi:SulP family sulfate permease